MDPNYERYLSPLEIAERKNEALTLMDELDHLEGEIGSHQNSIKRLKLGSSALDSRIRQLREEARSGIALLSRQTELPYADTLRERPKDPDDDVTPEHEKPELMDTKPPPPPAPDKFEQLYPMARTHGALRDYLHEVLSDEQYAVLVNGTVEAWDVRSGIFDGIAHWARVMKCRADTSSRAKTGEQSIGGLYVPGEPPMPVPLQELLKGVKKQKRLKKRRGGSTQHSD